VLSDSGWQNDNIVTGYTAQTLSSGRNKVVYDLTGNRVHVAQTNVRNYRKGGLSANRLRDKYIVRDNTVYN